MSGTAKVWGHHWQPADGRRLPWVRELAAARQTGDAFSVVLVFDSQQRRDFVRRRLTEQDVSARVLKPRQQPDDSDEDRRLSDRLLFVSCPGGEGQANLARAAAIAEEANRRYEMLLTPDTEPPDPSAAPPKPQRVIEGQHDAWPQFIPAQSSRVWGHRYDKSSNV